MFFHITPPDRCQPAVTFFALLFACRCNAVFKTANDFFTLSDIRLLRALITYSKHLNFRAGYFRINIKPCFLSSDNLSLPNPIYILTLGSKETKIKCLLKRPTTVQEAFKSNKICCTRDDFRMMLLVISFKAILVGIVTLNYPLRTLAHRQHLLLGDNI